MALSRNFSNAWFGVLRIYTGVFWLSHALQKMIGPDFGSPAGNIARIVSTSISSSTGAYHTFLAETVQPHLVLFATIFTYLELVIGCALILGFATRFGAAGGLCLAALYWFMSGQFASIGGYATDNAAAVILCLSCLILPVGMPMGLDGLRHRRRNLAPTLVK